MAGNDDDQPIEGTDKPVADEVLDALEDSEGLAWASMGLWTDLSIRSKPEVIDSTISALSRALKAEEDAIRRARREWLIQLALGILAAATSIPVLLALRSNERGSHSLSYLGPLLACLIGVFTFSIGYGFRAFLTARRDNNRHDLIKAVLSHERDYQRRISEPDPQT